MKGKVLTYTMAVLLPECWSGQRAAEQGKPGRWYSCLRMYL